MMMMHVAAVDCSTDVVNELRQVLERHPGPDDAYLVLHNSVGDDRTLLLGVTVAPTAALRLELPPEVSVE